MFVDRLGFEYTGTEGVLSQLRQVWEKYEKQAQERDAEWERYLEDYGLDSIEHRKWDPRLNELVNKGFPDKYRKQVNIYLLYTFYSGLYLISYYFLALVILDKLLCKSTSRIL